MLDTNVRSATIRASWKGSVFAEVGVAQAIVLQRTQTDRTGNSLDRGAIVGLGTANA